MAVGLRGLGETQRTQDLDELKVRLERFGEARQHRHGARVHASRKVVDLQQDDGTVVAKFSKTSEVKL